MNSLFLHLHQRVVLQAAKANRKGPGNRGHEWMRQRQGVGHSHCLAQRRRLRLREADLKRTMGRGSGVRGIGGSRRKCKASRWTGEGVAYLDSPTPTLLHQHAPGGHGTRAAGRQQGRRGAVQQHCVTCFWNAHEASQKARRDGFDVVASEAPLPRPGFSWLAPAACRRGCCCRLFGARGVVVCKKENGLVS